MEDIFLLWCFLRSQDFEQIGHIEATSEADPSQFIIHDQSRLNEFFTEVGWVDAMRLEQCEIDTTLE